MSNQTVSVAAGSTTSDGSAWSVRGKNWHRAIIIGLLLLFFAQMAFGARHLSLTSDEPAHIVRGYVALTSGDFWMVPLLGHPPLIEQWAALPLIVRSELPDPGAISHWGESAALYIQALLPELGTVTQLEILTRVPIMLLAMVLLSIVYRWASEVGGKWAGVCAAFLMALDPAMIAHSQLDTTDLGITLLLFTFMYLFHRMAKRPSMGWVLATGIGAGSAMAAKHSGVVVLPLAGALTGWAWLWHDGDFRHGSFRAVIRRLDISRAIRRGGRALAVMAISVATLWAIYGFETQFQTTFPWIVPFPSHIQSLGALFESQSRLSFLRGALREGGWWWYYIYVFLIKTPLPFLASILFSIYDELTRGWRAWLADVPLWLLPAVYWISVMGSEMQIGYRHLLPILPFIYVIVGRAVSRIVGTRGRIQKWVVLGCALWYAIGTLSIYPYPIAYFNELVSGPSNGYRHVVDSNVDWGHSFKALAEYMEKGGISKVNLSYYTWVDPALYGVDYEALPPAPNTDAMKFPFFAPRPGVYAISATPLQGILLRNPDLYGWFRHQNPVAQPGYGINVYRIPDSGVSTTWVAQCTIPTAPLAPEMILAGFGNGVERVTHFDCRQAWLYPGGRDTSGWFVLHGDILESDDDWLQTHLSLAQLSYRQELPGVLPPFLIYRWQPTPAFEMETSVYVPEHSEAVNDMREMTAPVSFEGPLALLGYRVVVTEDQEIELHTWWRVLETSERPFSLIGHAVDASGQAVLVADGLGIPFTELQVGDQFVQRHRFSFLEMEELPNSPVWLQTGGYWLDSMERWSVIIEGSSISDRVVLSEIDFSVTD